MQSFNIREQRNRTILEKLGIDPDISSVSYQSDEEKQDKGGEFDNTRVTKAVVVPAEVTKNEREDLHRNMEACLTNERLLENKSYQNIDQYCDFCAGLGHNENSCPHRLYSTSTSSSSESDDESTEGESAV
jgi:hypothetical protein